MTQTTLDAVLETLEEAGAVVFRYWIRPALRFDYVSPNARRLVGLEMEQVMAAPQRLYDAAHPDDHATLTALLTDASIHPDPAPRSPPVSPTMVLSASTGSKSRLRPARES